MRFAVKICRVLAASLFAVLAAGCGSGGMVPVLTPTPIPTPTVQNQWTWIDGSNLLNQPGTYGTLGTAAAGNIPGGRYGEVSWTDASESFCLFGGTAAPSTTQDNIFNDLWKYSGGEWTWMGGSTGFDQSGVYGTLGVADAADIPRARL